MRKEFVNIAGTRKRFIATFVRFGTKPAYKGPPIVTLLFEEVKDKYGKVYTDHLWFTMTKGFKAMDLKEGDRICFDARVKQYWKGYRGNRDIDDAKPVTQDYKLSHPNNFLKHTVGQQGQLF